MLDSKTFVVARKSPRWFIMGAHGVATDSCMVQHPQKKRRIFLPELPSREWSHIPQPKGTCESMIFPTSRERWDMDPFPANGIIAESPETLTFVRSTRYENCYTLHTPMLVSSPLPCISCRLYGNIMFHVKKWSISQTCFWFVLGPQAHFQLFL